MKRHIFAAVPNYTNTIQGDVSDGMLNAALECHREGWDFTRVRLPGRIHHIARNMLLGLFWHNEAYTHLHWWDDDVAVLSGNFVPFSKNDAPFVCAAYRHKRDEESYPGDMPEVGERKMRDGFDGRPLFNTLYWPIGFSQQTRECVGRILEAVNPPWEITDDFPGVKIPALFKREDGFIESSTGKRRVFGEDYAYCREWIDLGEDVWLDPTLTTGHAGVNVWWGCKGVQMQREVEAYRRDIALLEIAKTMGPSRRPAVQIARTMDEAVNQK